MLSVTAKRPLTRLGAAAGLLARPPVPVTLALPGAAVLLLAAAQALLAVVLVRLLRLLLARLGRLGDGLFDCFLFAPRLLFGGGGGGGGGGAAAAAAPVEEEEEEEEAGDFDLFD